MLLEHCQEALLRQRHPLRDRGSTAGAATTVRDMAHDRALGLARVSLRILQTIRHRQQVACKGLNCELFGALHLSVCAPACVSHRCVVQDLPLMLNSVDDALRAPPHQAGGGDAACHNETQAAAQRILPIAAQLRRGLALVSHGGLQPGHGFLFPPQRLLQILLCRVAIGGSASACERGTHRRQGVVPPLAGQGGARQTMGATLE
mmetsp:Transcript_12624/g.31526  ORF Transcript_12624/g.31526 Transcript_12624/m.31526 type:complete len:205 (+) Transcript_12624:42-656(+)